MINHAQDKYELTSSTPILHTDPLPSIHLSIHHFICPVLPLSILSLLFSSLTLFQQFSYTGCSWSVFLFPFLFSPLSVLLRPPPKDPPVGSVFLFFIFIYLWFPYWGVFHLIPYKIGKKLGNISFIIVFTGKEWNGTVPSRQTCLNIMSCIFCLMNIYCQFSVWNLL